MKLEVGMYVRTIYGIKKIISIECGQDIRFDNTDNFDKFLKEHHDNDGISKFEKHFWENEVIGQPSFNPIDLIKIGDYVNGKKVISINNISKNKYDHFVNTENHETIFYRQIKTILTKEQMENNCYRIGDQ